MARPWLHAAGVVIYPLPWLVFVQGADASWGPVLAGGWAVFALYLLAGITEFAMARRRVVPEAVTRLAGRHRAPEAERQVVRPQRVGRHRAPGRHALRATTSVAGGHRPA
ncbi:hypothetical protein [Tenggerimyces flavus]|uniref:Uncharacterized protein n=1 Tax=Tenggerimyces flavus TaxID=1708749 RepID=A0ABV7Y8I0_9ACTN|nr:hypothetical protein [Tenggerimyces flavus]MBM7786660.1 hypothetical protein [Tenggerimyces flavus]